LKTQEDKLQSMLEESPNPPGLDVVVESMLRYKTPVTLKNYLDLAHPGQEMKDLSAEEQTSIPRILLDPRVSELDPSETYYEEILEELARNPVLSVAKARRYMGAFG
jgi:hypothetical protein